LTIRCNSSGSATLQRPLQRPGRPPVARACLVPTVPNQQRMKREPSCLTWRTRRPAVRLLSRRLESRRDEPRHLFPPPPFWLLLHRPAPRGARCSRPGKFEHPTTLEGPPGSCQRQVLLLAPSIERSSVGSAGTSGSLLYDTVYERRDTSCTSVRYCSCDSLRTWRQGRGCESRDVRTHSDLR